MVGKVHDNSKDTGKKANFFEQEIAKRDREALKAIGIRPVIMTGHTTARCGAASNW